MLKIKVLRTNNFRHARKNVAIICIIPLKSAIVINIISAVDYHSQSQCSCPADRQACQISGGVIGDRLGLKSSLTAKVFYYYLVVSIVYR
jgi:hypothetical protein